MKRILVVKLAGIGDLLTAFPALRALRERFPRAEITALTTPQSAPLLDGQGLVDRVVVLDKYLFDDGRAFARPRSMRGLVRLGLHLRSRAFDGAILLHHLVTWPGVAKYALLMVAAGARVRAGLDDGRGRFLTVSVRDGGFGARHEVEYWLGVVGLLGATSSNPRIQLRWGEEEATYAERSWDSLGLAATEDVVAIHPGTGSYSPVRRWDPRGFTSLAEGLSGQGLAPLIVAGPGEEELARGVAESVPRARVAENVPSVLHLAALLKRCRLFIGNDSGVMHTAVAAGVPTIGIFGPSNHRAWGPHDPGGSRSRIVRAELPCSPCLYRGQSLGLRNGCGDPRCLRLVTADHVMAEARQLLGR